MFECNLHWGRSLAKLLVLALLFVLACAPQRGFQRDLEQRFPQLEKFQDNRLADTTPYFFPGSGGVSFFVCRWDATKPVSVSLSESTSEPERALILRALSAWEQAGLGLHFVEVADHGAIRIELLDEEARTDLGIGGSGNTVADCRVNLDVDQAAKWTAELSSASLQLSRTTAFDLRGQRRAVTEEELFGVLLHELGHALGFQGHVFRGQSVMVRDTFAIRIRAGRILQGQRFRDETVQALYALPSGSIVKRLSLEAAQIREFSALQTIAEQRGWEGPFVCVGNRRGRIYWRDENGFGIGFLIKNYNEVMRGAESFRLLFDSPLPSPIERRDVGT